MKTKLSLFIFVLLILSSLMVSFDNAGAYETGVFSFSAGSPAGNAQTGFLPRFDTSLDDLDVRDTNNNPVNTPQSKEMIENLFRSGLYNLLLCAELYSFSQVIEQLRKKLGLGSCGLRSDSAASVKNLIAVLAPFVKKLLAKTVSGFSGSLVLDISGFSSVISLTARHNSSAVTSLSVLRC